ncbi:MAG TPA: ATP-binding cassette domain-containing protein [Chitinivibrionales bacterium]|nr:ATP-binding cassette domain-containing protein [Chitinivibrionales bacterium]
MIAVQTENLAKRFKKFLAVDGISFTVNEGEVFGFLGPNGAGKTTTINMLSTLIAPSSGGARIMGYDIVKKRNEVRRSIGVVFQDPALDSRLTGRENLEFHAHMYGMPARERNGRIAEVLALVELEDKAAARVETYSGGMKRRLEIARGLMHRPKVLFLDEPTIGLDAQTRRHIWTYVKKLNAETGITMILTTHYMEEADALSHRILILDRGRIVALDTPSALKDVLGGDVIELGIAGDTSSFVNAMRSAGWVKSVAANDGCVRLSLEKAELHVAPVVQAAADHGVALSCVNIRKPSLDDVFIHFTGKTIREGGNDATEGKPSRRGHRRRR